MALRAVALGTRNLEAAEARGSMEVDAVWSHGEENDHVVGFFINVGPSLYHPSQFSIVVIRIYIAAALKIYLKQHGILSEYRNRKNVRVDCLP